jgi:hypothetical protein
MGTARLLAAVRAFRLKRQVFVAKFALGNWQSQETLHDFNRLRDVPSPLQEWA